MHLKTSEISKVFAKTFIFFSKVAVCCLICQIFLEKYFDLNKIHSYYWPVLHWGSNFVFYYPYSYLLLYLKNSNYLEKYKKKNERINKNDSPSFTMREAIIGEAQFLGLCILYNNFMRDSSSNGHIFLKLLWFYVCIFLADIFFFIAHRVLHSHLFWIHKRHHLEVNTNGFSAEIKSFSESIITTLTDILVFVIFGRDMNQFVAWIIVGVLYNVEGHSCLSLFFIEDDFFHINHHLYVECNYGIGYYLDYLFGTARFSCQKDIPNVHNE